MPDSFADKVFLVTGASSGIGEALVRELISRGAFVAGMARTKDALQGLEKQFPGKFLPLVGDVTQESDCKKSVEETIRKTGRMDGLIHNAGVTLRALAHETKTEVFESLMNVNYYGLVHLYRHSYPHLVKNQGHVVGISSMMGKYSTQFRSGYSASKHALQAFLNSIRLELAPTGVHVMTVSPGFVKTAISHNALNAEGKKHGQMDEATEAGMEPSVVARAIADGIEARKRDLYPAGGKEKFALFLSRFAPGMLDRLLLKIKVT